MSENAAAEGGTKRRFGCGQVLLIMLVTAVVSAGAMLWWAKHYLYASELRPVALSVDENEQLEGKLELLEEAALGGEVLPEAPAEGSFADGEPTGQDPRAEAYEEDLAGRELHLTERELNALIAKNDPDAARHVAVDLSRDLVSVKVIVPMDEDVPLLGGKTVRIKAGFGVVFDGTRAEVILKGVSLGGIPLPSAWLGGMKGKDFIQEFGEDGGFWKQFSDGIEHLEVRDGRLTLKLKE